MRIVLDSDVGFGGGSVGGVPGTCEIGLRLLVFGNGLSCVRESIVGNFTGFNKIAGDEGGSDKGPGRKTGPAKLCDLSFCPFKNVLRGIFHEGIELREELLGPCNNVVT